jgi:hypothetical protein
MTDASGGSGDCVSCHENGGTLTYSTDFDGANGHKVQDHTGVTGFATCSTTCHGGDVVNLDVTPDVHNDTCSNCHTDINTNGTLRAGANGWGTAVGGAGDCASCHGAYSTNYKVHDVQDHTGVTGQATCTECHGGMYTVILVQRAIPMTIRMVTSGQVLMAMEPLWVEPVTVQTVMKTVLITPIQPILITRLQVIESRITLA